jgi:hypothetical protein
MPAETISRFFVRPLNRVIPNIPKIVTYGEIFCVNLDVLKSFR